MHHTILFSIFSVYQCCCYNLSQHKLMPSILNLITSPISITGTNKYWNIYSYDNNCFVCLRVAITSKYIKYCSDLLNKRLLSYFCLCWFTRNFSVLWKNPSKIRTGTDIVNPCIITEFKYLLVSSGKKIIENFICMGVYFNFENV